MSQQTLLNAYDVEQMALNEYTEKAYLNYSMYVILDRALPHIGDGLKPVQRRIVYAMSELGLKHTSKFKKSARTVGDVLGKYHPHGDSACYEAMVLMAQPFSYRYPLIDGQGNWGATDDPKSFAAMRYTEAKLSQQSQLLLSEIEQGTVDWNENFDGTLKEPAVLPARLPMVLLNGSSGIAVGMATDIPPHNLREIAAALIHIIDHPEAAVEDLCQYVQGPDYCSHAEIITPRHDLVNLYKTGKGSLRVRAVYEIENDDIVIHALPHQVSGAKVLEQIADQMQKKRLPMVTDLRDESDHENPTRLVITPRSKRIDVEQLMGHLFATTDLERSYRVNLNVIGTNGKPKVYALNSLLSEWLSYRSETILRRIRFNLDKINARIHILEGLLIAYLNLDQVIAIIREEDEPDQVLLSRFALSEKQIEAILNLKLKQLAKLEESKLNKEQKDLNKERTKLEAILKSEKKLKTLIKNEILESVNTFGDARRSQVVKRDEAQQLSQHEITPSENITVVLSKKGWVRVARGHDLDLSKLGYKSGDEFLVAVEGKSNQSGLFFDTTGRCYTLPIHTLPTARGYGDPLTGKVNAPSGASFVGVMVDNREAYYIISSDAGYGYIAKYEDMITRNKSGKLTLSLPKNGLVLPPKKIDDPQNDKIAVVSNEGRLLIFSANQLPFQSKGKGNKMINIPSVRVANREEYVVDYCAIKEGDSLIIHAGKREFKLPSKDVQYYYGERARRGNKLPRGFQRVNKISVVSTQDNTQSNQNEGDHTNRMDDF